MFIHSSFNIFFPLQIKQSFLTCADKAIPGIQSFIKGQSMFLPPDIKGDIHLSFIQTPDWQMSISSL